MSDQSIDSAAVEHNGWGEWSRYVLENIREAKMAINENQKRLHDLEQRVTVLAEKVLAESVSQRDLKVAIETAARAAEAAESAAKAADSAAKAAVAVAEKNAGKEPETETDANLMTVAGWKYAAARYGSVTVVIIAILLTVWKAKGWL